MKPNALLLVCFTALAGWETPASLAAAEPPPPSSWSLRVAMQERDWPLHSELRETLKSIFVPYQTLDFLQHLSSLEVEGLATKKAEMGFIVRLQCEDEPTAAKLIEALNAKPRVAWETVNGQAVAFVPDSLSTGGAAPSDCWVFIPAPQRLVVCTSREALEAAVRQPVRPEAAAQPGHEFLSADVDLHDVKAAIGKSEILSMLGGRLGVKFSTDHEQVRVVSTAELADARTANRARRILEGMIAALATAAPQQKPALDERLEVAAEGASLKAQITLTGPELKAWLESIAADLKK